MLMHHLKTKLIIAMNSKTNCRIFRIAIAAECTVSRSNKLSAIKIKFLYAFKQQSVYVTDRFDHVESLFWASCFIAAYKTPLWISDLFPMDSETLTRSLFTVGCKKPFCIKFLYDTRKLYEVDVCEIDIFQILTFRQFSDVEMIWKNAQVRSSTLGFIFLLCAIFNRLKY